MLTAEDIARVLGLSVRAARERLAALRADGAPVVQMRTGRRGRPPLAIERQALAERLGVGVEELAA